MSKNDEVCYQLDWLVLFSLSFKNQGKVSASHNPVKTSINFFSREGHTIVITESETFTDRIPSALFLIERLFFSSNLSLCSCYGATDPAFIIRCDLNHQRGPNTLVHNTQGLGCTWRPKDIRSHKGEQLLFSVWLNSAQILFGPI